VVGQSSHDLRGHVVCVGTHAGEQGGPSSPLPAPPHEVQARDGRHPPRLDEASIRALRCGYAHPLAVVPISGRPDQSVDVGNASIGKAHGLAVPGGEAWHDCHAGFS